MATLSMRLDVNLTKSERDATMQTVAAALHHNHAEVARRMTHDEAVKSAMAKGAFAYTQEPEDV